MISEKKSWEEGLKRAKRYWRDELEWRFKDIVAEKRYNHHLYKKVKGNKKAYKQMIYSCAEQIFYDEYLNELIDEELTQLMDFWLDNHQEEY